MCAAVPRKVGAAWRKIVADVAVDSSQKPKCRVVTASSSPKPVAGTSTAASEFFVFYEV